MSLIKPEPESCTLCGLHNPTGTVPGFTLPVFTALSPNSMLMQVVGDDGTVLGFVEFPDDLTFETVPATLKSRSGSPAIYAFAPPAGALPLVGTKVDLGPKVETFIDDEALKDLPVLRLDLIRFCDRRDLLPAATQGVQRYLQEISEYSAEHWRDHGLLSPISRSALRRWYSSIAPVDPSDASWWEAIVLRLHLGKPKLQVPGELRDLLANNDEWRSALRNDLEPYIKAFGARLHDIEIESANAEASIVPFRAREATPESTDSESGEWVRQSIGVAAEQSGLRVVAHPGQNKVLIAMSLDEASINNTDKNLAGFAIWRKVDGKEVCLGNRITFAGAADPGVPARASKWTDSDKAPIQKFRWVDIPPDGSDREIHYRVRALYFAGNGTQTTAGPECSLSVRPAKVLHTHFRPAFTRGYIASQAYADKFHNAGIRPDGPKTADFDTKPYQPQYHWLGADARAELFAFIADCENDHSCGVDVFAIDLDEPDVIGGICKLGNAKRKGTVRAILDNAPRHTKPDKYGNLPPEIKAAVLIKAALGTPNVKQGYLDRYRDSKPFIVKRDAAGKGQKVIFGTMNFSIRGLYVQTNNVIVVEDATVAQYFADAFDEAFSYDINVIPFRKATIAQGYMPGSMTDTAELPVFSLALSPHTDPVNSLGPIIERIRSAKSSVLYAVMAPSGQGPVLSTLREIAAEPAVFSYGMVETAHGLAVQSPDGAMGAETGYAALSKQVPPPFTREFSDTGGIYIHNKFVVVDFNGQNPTVFAGSAIPTPGREKLNGDGLMMIQDAAIANMYAIEAVATFDHYHYRSKVRDATKVQPLTLWYPGKQGMPTPWWKGYYDHSDIKLRDRCLFAGVPLPSGVETTKTADWSTLDKPAAMAKGGDAKKVAKKTAKKAAKKTTSKKAATRKKAPKKKVAKKAAKKAARKIGKKKAPKKTAKMSAKKAKKKSR